MVKLNTLQKIYLLKYSKVLITQIPLETVNVLIRLCVSYHRFAKDSKNRQLEKRSNLKDGKAVKKKV